MHTSQLATHTLKNHTPPKKVQTVEKKTEPLHQLSPEAGLRKRKLEEKEGGIKFHIPDIFYPSAVAAQNSSIPNRHKMGQNLAWGKEAFPALEIR